MHSRKSESLRSLVYSTGQMKADRSGHNTHRGTTERNMTWWHGNRRQRGALTAPLAFILEVTGSRATVRHNDRFLGHNEKEIHFTVYVWRTRQLVPRERGILIKCKRYEVSALVINEIISVADAGNVACAVNIESVYALKASSLNWKWGVLKIWDDN